jgi:hypothetical protein
MPTTLPQLQKQIDTAFTQTWFDIRADAEDNILLGIPIWRILKDRGCFKTQVGGQNIERTLHYALPTTQDIVKGSVIQAPEVETRTAAFWNWKYEAVGITRSFIDDQKNQGAYRIQSYVQNRVTEARDSMTQHFEVAAYVAETTDESGIAMQGLNDMVPSQANSTTGTYGGVARSNTWWVPKYKQLNLPYEVNLASDMRNLYNGIWANLEPPNLIVSDQNLYEVYEEEILDTSQVIKSKGTMDGDLGYLNMYFKGAEWIWTPNHAANGLTMFNTNYIEVVYDPTAWFVMTAWKEHPNQLERVAQIVCVCNMVSDQLRRHGRAYTNTTDG